MQHYADPLISKFLLVVLEGCRKRDDHVDHLVDKDPQSLQVYMNSANQHQDSYASTGLYTKIKA